MSKETYKGLKEKLGFNDERNDILERLATRIKKCKETLDEKRRVCGEYQELQRKKGELETELVKWHDGLKSR